jgi:soluble lytic murein transglycosylase
MFLATIRRSAALVLAAMAAHAQPSLETELPALREAAQRGNLRALETARPRFAGHPLEAYPSYWLLMAQMERGADPAEVAQFLARHADTPLAEAMRREWLRTLGAAGSWELFRAELPRMLGDDAEIACYALQERLARSDRDAVAEARALFVAGREAPAACDAVFTQIAAERVIGTEDAWARLRKLLAANALRDAKRTAALLPARETFNEKTLDRAAQDPAAFLAREKSPVLPRAARELALYAVGRVARGKPEEAAERLALLSDRLGPADMQHGWALIAHQAAMIHSPRALEWYNEARDAPLTEAQVAWKARAALRAGDWKLVLSAIQALPPEEAREATWRYWRARALRQLGEREAAEALLRTVARERNFYGLLAADELGLSVPPDWSTPPAASADLDRVRAYPGVRRALMLYRVGLDNEAFREWNAAVRSLDDRDLIVAAELASRAELADRAIHTSDRTVQVHDFAQRYPVPHREALAAAARLWNMDEAILYAIIRQESRFMPEARSRVGATGLMQLMPATARWVASQIGMKPYHPDMLRRPEVNVNMGTYYFGRVLAQLGHPMLATAAYNAGPGRARRWRDERPLDGAIYAETIPFNETRDYVKKVFANAWFYRHRLSGQSPSMRALVGTVPGKLAEPAPAIASSAP